MHVALQRFFFGASTRLGMRTLHTPIDKAYEIPLFLLLLWLLL